MATVLRDGPASQVEYALCTCGTCRSRVRYVRADIDERSRTVTCPKCGAERDASRLIWKWEYFP